MKPITLPIFHNNDHTSTLNELEIPFNLADADIKEMVFFNINAIGIERNNGKDYGLIFCNGDTFTTSLTYEELKTKLLNI